MNEGKAYMDKIAVLIPCYNESQTIEKVVTDFKKCLPEAVVYMYDNNSTDETCKNAKFAGAIVRSEKMQGKGNVVRRMFADIDADVYNVLLERMEEFKRLMAEARN